MPSPGRAAAALAPSPTAAWRRGQLPPRPEPGHPRDPAISHRWDEARYLFANARNRATFAAASDKYAPQFAGLCATGLAFGQKVEADPQAWKIVDGKLYLFSSIPAKEVVDKDPGVLARAIARAAVDAFHRAPLPPPAGQIGPGSPADQASIIRGPAALPETVEVSEKPMDLPRDAGHLP